METIVKTFLGIEIIEPSGNIDLYAVPALKTMLTDMVSQNKKKILINLKKVGFIDSSGIGLLLGMIITFKNNKVNFKLACASPAVEKILSITKIGKEFTIYATQEEAIRSFDI
jgi:anti-sigma B factor antagonist